MLRASYGKKQGNVAVELMWDFKKCFEQVHPDLLWHLAGELGYPRVLLILSSLQSYAWPRKLAMQEGLSAPAIQANHGIVAGSAMAVFELT